MESFLWAKSRLRARPRPAGMGHEEIPGNPRSGSESIVKAIAQLDEHFARLEKVRAAEGEAVVEQHAAIGDVDGLQIDGEALAELLAEREIKRGVRLKMVARSHWRLAAVGEAGSVVDVGGRVRSEEHTSELQSRLHLVCRLLLEKKKSD